MIYSFPLVICLMIVVCKTSWNLRLQTNFHAIKYINLIYIYIYYYYIIALFQILSTLQIISHLVCHNPTKWISDNQYCYNIYIYIYIYMGTQLISILKKVIFVQKICLRSCHFCICIFAFINQSQLTSLKISWDTSQTQMFDLLWKIWRIKTKNDLRNLFPPRIFKIHFLAN